MGGGGWICLGLISLGLTLDLVWLIWVGAEMEQLGEQKLFDLGFEKKKVELGEEEREGFRWRERERVDVCV